MQRSTCRFTRSITVLVGGLVLCTAITLGSPLISQAQKATAPAKPMPAIGNMEAQLSDLHSKLKITSAQEPQWNKVAAVMRENTAGMESLLRARQQKGETLNAVEDLKFFARVTEAQLTGLNKFIPVFEVLYNSMSDQQKKTADTLLTRQGPRQSPKKK